MANLNTENFGDWGNTYESNLAVYKKIAKYLEREDLGPEFDYMDIAFQLLECNNRFVFDSKARERFYQDSEAQNRYIMVLTRILTFLPLTGASEHLVLALIDFFRDEKLKDNEVAQKIYNDFIRYVIVGKRTTGELIDYLYERKDFANLMLRDIGVNRFMLNSREKEALRLLLNGDVGPVVFTVSVLFPKLKEKRTALISAWYHQDKTIELDLYLDWLLNGCPVSTGDEDEVHISLMGAREKVNKPHVLEPIGDKEVMG